MAPVESEERTLAGGFLFADELRDAWPLLSDEERAEAFHLLRLEEAQQFFLNLDTRGQAAMLAALPPKERGLWLRSLAPDDAADLLQAVPPEPRAELLELLDERTRKEVGALLAYAEDDAGGLMSPRFARVRPDMTVDEAIRYLRKQVAERLETIYYAYVLDPQQKLLGVVSLRQLFGAPGDKKVSEVMQDQVVSVPADMDQEAVAAVLRDRKLMAVPVVDAQGRMQGIITLDDLVQVLREEATEDLQKFGGMGVVDTPYLQTSIPVMVRKRVGWLAILFVAEMFTASAMQHYQEHISRVVILALFVPLIISSGGNSGSQASTLVIRAMALGEVALRDWWRVVLRELWSGLLLGGILAVIGFLCVTLFGRITGGTGDLDERVAATVALSLVFVVTWGTLVGTSLPFLLRRVGLDPASASAPFVATLVDVFGLVIYFSVATLLLKNALS
ncbi:MAG: magnesium transporter [Planctomycetota bacterium]|nr:MAG: magnesium transporter [Planctomycetota bacterium]